jgi:lysophospholipase L1-like esterase
VNHLLPLRRTLAWLALLASLLAIGGCKVWRLSAAKELAQRSEPLSQAPPNPAARLLVVGDSTGVGTGASSAQHSLVGLLATAYPRLHIDNRAEDGALFEDVLRQIALVEEGRRYDMTLILAGGNDVIRMHDLDATAADVAQATRAAAERADLIVLMPAGNVGNAPFFFAPLSWLMSDRSRTLHAAVARAAESSGAAYVDLFRDKANDPFVHHPKMNAADGLHPSDAGYLDWFDQLLKNPRVREKLAPAAN